MPILETPNTLKNGCRCYLEIAGLPDLIFMLSYLEKVGVCIENNILWL